MTRRRPSDAGSSQLELLAEVTARAAELADVVELQVLGSARQPELLDRWSDVDIGLVLRGPVALSSLLPAGAVVWALDRQSGHGRSTCRVVLSDGQRLDLVVTGTLAAPEPTDASVNEARFVAALALVKYGRGDLLIGSHLTLELARLCLVQAMLLRDRDEGTTSHRFGTGRDELAAETWAALTVGGAPAVAGTARVEQLVGQFDRLHSELDDGYAPDWSGLESLARRRPETGAKRGGKRMTR